MTESFIHRLSLFQLTNVVIKVIKCNISSQSEVKSAFQSIQSTLPPICAIIHSARLEADGTYFTFFASSNSSFSFHQSGTLVNQSWSNFFSVFPVKMAGAINLHLASLDIETPLDFFLLNTSISSLFGSPAQAPMAAANSFLDCLATYRRLQGQTAVLFFVLFYRTRLTLPSTACS